MKTYKQSEWTEIIDKRRGGRLGVLGVSLTSDMTISHLRIVTVLSGTLSAYGILEAEDITEIPGRKQFSFTVGKGVSLVVDSDEVYRFKTVVPEGGIENPKRVPFQKWLKDYIEKNNKTHTRADDKIHSIEIDTCEVNDKGIIRSVNAKVTWGEVYGPFGRLTTNKALEIGRDILGGVYEMRRNDDIRDDWTPTCFGDYGYRAYFTDGFDIVYADDGRYTTRDDAPFKVDVSR